MKRTLGLLLCVVLIVSLFSGVGSSVQAKTNGIKVVQNTLDGRDGFTVSVSHDAISKKLTIVIDGTNSSNEDGINQYFTFTPKLSVEAGGNAGWSEPVYDNGQDEDPLKSTIVYTYTNPEALYGAYKICFSGFNLYYQLTGSSGTTNKYSYDNYYITALFPMSDDQEDNVGLTAQVRKVLDDGSPTESGYLAEKFTFDWNAFNFSEMYIKAEPLFSEGQSLPWGYDYSYEWTAPSGEKVSGQKIHVQTYGKGDYKVKITATRKDTTEGEWAADIGYKESYTAEKTICVEPATYTTRPRWGGDVQNNTIKVGKALKFFLQISGVTSGQLVVTNPNGDVVVDSIIDGKGEVTFTLVDSVRTKHGGTYTWSFTPDNQLFVKTSGSLTIAVEKAEATPVVLIPQEIMRGSFEGQVQMEANVPGIFTIASKNADETEVLFHEVSYTYTDAPIVVDYKDLIIGQPAAGAYKLDYVFVPVEEETVDYLPANGSIDYTIAEKSEISIVQANGGTIEVGGKTDASFFVNKGEDLTVTVTPEEGTHVYSSVQAITLNGQPMENVTIHGDGSATGQFTVEEHGKTYEVSAIYDVTKLALKSGQTYYMDGDITADNRSEVEKALFDILCDEENSVLPDVENAQISMQYLSGYRLQLDSNLVSTNVDVYHALDTSTADGVINWHAFGAHSSEKVKIIVTLNGKTLENTVDVTVLSKTYITNTSYQTTYTYNAEPIPAPANEQFHITSNATPSFEWYQGETKLNGTPTEIGTYTLKVHTAAQNSYGVHYGAATLEVPVVISEYSCLDASLSGMLGDNGWYVDDVHILAPEGYVISSDMQTWSEQISVTEDLDAEYSYSLKNTENGYVAKKTIKVQRDTVAPVIEGIADGETYEVTKTFTVTDANLKEVTINDKSVTECALTANGTYTVKAIDQAGHETAMTVTVKVPATSENDDENTTEDDDTKDESAGSDTDGKTDGTTDDKTDGSTDNTTENDNTVKNVVAGAGKNKALYSIVKSGKTGGTASFVAPQNKKATNIVIPATVKVSGVTYKVTAIEKNAFKKNKNIKSVTIGKNVKTIGKEAFSSCTKLKTVKFGSGVTTIGDKAFYKCSALAKISLPSKVKTIGKSAFYGCKNATSITIGKNVNKIDSKAFYGCSKVKILTIKSPKLTAKGIGSKAFSKTPKSMTVKVPKKKLKTYKTMLNKRGVNKKARFKKI